MMPTNSGKDRKMADTDTLKEELERLRAEHRVLDGQIAELTGTPVSDQLRIQRLKRRKLSLKDKISRLENQLIPDIIA